jgi:hypothetical protein
MKTLANKISIGDRVVPVSKSVANYLHCRGLDDSSCWKIARYMQQPYLFVVGRRPNHDQPDNPCYAVSECRDSAGGDFFLHSDLQLYVDEVTEQKTVHQLMLEHLALQPGDTVRVLRKAADRELGWGSVWLPEMDQFVGKELECIEVREEYGVRLNCHRGGPEYLFPAQILDVCSRAASKRTVQLSEHCSAVVSATEMTVSGGLITREKFLELHAAAMEVGFIS